MAPDRGHPRLPRVLVADAGRHSNVVPAALPAGVLLRDTDLGTLVDRATLHDVTLAVDIDTVRGLGSDDTAVEFVVRGLGIGIVLARRPQTAARVAELGGLGLLHMLAFDSTGLGRSLDGHPHSAHVGSVVSPGLVLMHMARDELQRLPRPVLAYGLIGRVAEARTCLGLADAIVVTPVVADALADAVGPARQPVRKPLTTALAEE
jgi:glycerol-3-phosphate responsive antiterminator